MFEQLFIPVVLAYIVGGAILTPFVLAAGLYAIGQALARKWLQRYRSSHLTQQAA